MIKYEILAREGCVMKASSRIEKHTAVNITTRLSTWNHIFNQKNIS